MPGPKPTDSMPLTEQINPRTTNLDRLPLRTVLERILDEDAGVAAAVRARLSELEAAAELLSECLAQGGRWFNVGSGTSGRLGVLDAVELPPTFGLESDRVQSILAGGSAALERAVEGAEDDFEGGGSALRARSVGPGDVVVAISASGRTPFVLGAVEAARELGARTIAVTCDPDSPLAAGVDIPIAAAVGPEVISGSTRMKGGLAQKMILHSLSTSVMVRLGRVRGNLMAELQLVNAKLRERAVRVISRLAGVSAAEAAEALEEAGGSVRAALEKLGVPRRGARR
jgi:N-acetylmuramic acid 6-phosphate etherase